MRFNNKHTGNPLIFGLAMTAGIGVILMILALAFGVLQGETADGRTIGLVLAAGFALFLLGSVAWALVTRPFDHFDDINQPLDTGYGHGHAAPSTALAVHDTDTEHAVEPVLPH